MITQHVETVEKNIETSSIWSYKAASDLHELSPGGRNYLFMEKLWYDYTGSEKEQIVYI